MRADRSSEGHLRSEPAASAPDEPPESAYLAAVRELLAGPARAGLAPAGPAAARVEAIAAGLDTPSGADETGARGATERAGRALDALEQLAREGTGGRDWSWDILYAVERTRLAGAREIAEADLADALRQGAVVLPPAEQDLAARLLGAGGTSTRARLGLDDQAGDEDVHRAAQEQLATWRARAAHPASSRAVRDAALVLAGTCEAVLADTAG